MTATERSAGTNNQGELRRCRHGGVWEPYGNHSFKCSKCGDVDIGWEPDDYDDNGNPSTREADQVEVSPRSVTIVVPMAPPKELATNRRKYRWEAAKATKELREAAMWSVYEQFGYFARGQLHRMVDVHEHIVWPKGQRRYDPDTLATLCKPALDGIVDAGLIPNDSAVYIRNLTTSQAVGEDGQGRIEITLREVQ